MRRRIARGGRGGGANAGRIICQNEAVKPKNTICLWFDKEAFEAATFYAATFPDSEVKSVHRAPNDYPGGKRATCLR
jgi:hypothetical protein